MRRAAGRSAPASPSPTSSTACTPRSRSARRSRTARRAGWGSNSISSCSALAYLAEGGVVHHLDLALLDSQIALLAYQNSNYFSTGSPPKRIGNLHPNIVPYQPFRTRDGSVILACGNDNLYRKFCEVAGCAELADDARFASNG